MNLYLWERIDKATDSYHPEGGLVVIAEDEAAARALANAADGVGLSADERPTAVYELASGQPRVFVFPDAGCC